MAELVPEIHDLSFSNCPSVIMLYGDSREGSFKDSIVESETEAEVPVEPEVLLGSESQAEAEVQTDFEVPIQPEGQADSAVQVKGSNQFYCQESNKSKSNLCPELHCNSIGNTNKSRATHRR